MDSSYSLIPKNPKTRIKVTQRNFKYYRVIGYLSRVHNESYAVNCDGSLGDVCGYNTFSNALRSHVKNLPRKKFHAVRNFKVCFTVYGRCTVSVSTEYGRNPPYNQLVITSSYILKKRGRPNNYCGPLVVGLTGVHFDTKKITLLSRYLSRNRRVEDDCVTTRPYLTVGVTGVTFFVTASNETSLMSILLETWR